MPKEPQEPSRIKRGRDGRQKKRNTQRKGSQGVQKKQNQQRAESPKGSPEILHRHTPDAERTSQEAIARRVTPSQRAKWQPLPNSSREHLESMMHYLIKLVLYKTTENYNETDKHLNLLKKRLLKRCQNLQVPVETQSCSKNVPKFLAKERKKSVVLKKALSKLQGELDKVVQAAEIREETIQHLQKEVQALKCELAAEEAAFKLFQKTDKDVLALPDFSKDCQKPPILQKMLLKVKDQQGLLDDLNTIQQSEEMKAVSVFVEQANEKLDLLNK
ncbi:hypothetical protein JRQ81_001709 [Phrynocephalus forsythii]|uniref:Centromere protein Q n=1 Tax=Phrynocephalus forsythii TaxID=171643 RepID=A0A9Q0YBJ5_9SAUR|nr:hypothetical protein JRQ81_001709 [Phrynocephalus forsythii]